jgi:hypothetical protein
MHGPLPEDVLPTGVSQLHVIRLTGTSPATSLNSVNREINEENPKTEVYARTPVFGQTFPIL